ncbi:hypothetical protein D3C71_1333110 [compost metagenome]
MRQAGRLGNDGLQALGLAAGEAREKLGRGHHALRAAAIRERNGPEPYVRVLRVHADQNLLAIDVLRIDAVLDMREQRAAHRKVRRCLQRQQPGQHAAKAAGIEQELGLHLVFAAFGVARGDTGPGAAHIRGQHGVAITDFGAGLGGGIGQHLVKIAALHLVGRAPAGRELVAEIKGRARLALGKGRAVLVLEAGLYHSLQEPGLFEVSHALRQQAFANRKAWKELLLQDQHPASLLAQQTCGHGPRGAGTNDENVCLLHGIHGCFSFRETSGARARKVGASTSTSGRPTIKVVPKALSAGVWDRPSRPKDSQVLPAPMTTASQAEPSSSCSSRKMP